MRPLKIKFWMMLGLLMRELSYAERSRLHPLFFPIIQRTQLRDVANPSEVSIEVAVGMTFHVNPGAVGDEAKAEVASDAGKVSNSFTCKARANLEEGKASMPETLSGGKGGEDNVRVQLEVDCDDYMDVIVDVKKKFVAWNFIRVNEDHVSNAPRFAALEFGEKLRLKDLDVRVVVSEIDRTVQRKYEKKVKIIDELNGRNVELVSKVTYLEVVYAWAEGKYSSAGRPVAEHVKAVIVAQADVAAPRAVIEERFF
ncbi:hypothetical protein ACFE04_004386 [Oxalis oulophora]